jgi:hypothetical protein
LVELCCEGKASRCGRASRANVEAEAEHAPLLLGGIDGTLEKATLASAGKNDARDVLMSQKDGVLFGAPTLNVRSWSLMFEPRSGARSEG